MPNQLAGSRVLVVEDAPLIAAELEEELVISGAVVIGPATNLDRALKLAAREQIDAAVLDLDLGDATSFPIADLLIEKNVPFLFTTGFDDGAVPDRYAGAPRLFKPVVAGDVITTLAQLIEPDQARR